MEYLNRFQLLRNELTNNQSINLMRFDISQPGDISQNSDELVFLDSYILEFYRLIKSVRLQWESSVFDDPDIAGEVKILPLERVLMDWKDDIYSEDYGTQDLRRFYHPIDFFVPEASVGILIQEKINPELFFFTYGEEIIPLGVDFRGYIELLIAAKGFFYWQMLIISLISGHNFEEAQRFRDFMPRLFPDFKISHFEKIYANHKLN